MQSENDDGDDDEDYDLVPVTPRGASVLMPSSSPVTENRSRILAPVDANDPNSARRFGRPAPGPILGQTENIDPKESNSQKLARNRGRPQLSGESSDEGETTIPAVKKYKTRALDPKKTDRGGYPASVALLHGVILTTVRRQFRHTPYVAEREHNF